MIGELPPQPVLVNASRFRDAHAGDWERLDHIVSRMEKRSIRAVGDDDLISLPLLYRSALSSLSIARATSLDRALIAYLEQLCARAYFQIYGVPMSAARQIYGFFNQGWPAAVRAIGRETLVAVVLMMLGTLAGYLLVTSDPSWFFGIIPETLAAGRDPSADVQTLRATLYQRHDDMLATFAIYLFSHNSQIAIFAFALGFAFAIPSILLIIYNGLMLGAMLAVFIPKGLGIGFVGWLAIHGTTELFAITLAGAAGIRIGTAIAFPGRELRSESAVRAGRGASVAMAGTVIMLCFAGLLEGIGRQTIVDDATRYAIGCTALAGWLFYFYLPRGKKRALAVSE